MMYYGLENNATEKFEILRQTSYNNHSDHAAFLQNIGLKQVKDFLQIDYTALNKS